jgi:apolipoprotein N-acyltransferase
MREVWRGPRSLRTATALALLGGALWGLAHGLEARPWLGAAALVPLLLVAGSPRPFLAGWLFGIAAWSTAVPWILPTVSTFGLLPGWVGAAALLLLAAILGAYEGLFAWLGARLWRRGDGLALAALPALWGALEVARGKLLTGFPWNLAAYAWIDLPGALALSSWTGAWGVSLLVVAVNVGLARALVVRRPEPAIFGVLVALLLLAVGARFAGGAESRAAPQRVRIVQPDIPNRPFFDAAASVADYQRLLAMSSAACASGVLVLWPESASWPREWQEDPRLRADLRELALGGGCTVLFNSAYTVGERTFNSVLLVGAAGTNGAGPGSRALVGAEGLDVQRADKRHLVPFGEYVPLRRLFPFLGKIARSIGDFSPADELRLLDWRGERLGAAVCYEVVFPGETAALVRAGATLLVTVTNDAWYGDSAAPRQHLRAARFRAAENRRWLLRAAVTGISAVVRPNGTLAASADVGATTVLDAVVVGRRDRSPYARAPWLVPAVCFLLAALAILRERRGRGAS